MYRRLIVIALSLALMIVPVLSVSAAETTGNSFNVLDYVSADGTNSNFFSFTGSKTVNYNFESMLGRMRCFWFDIIYVVTSKDCSLESITSGVHTIDVSESLSGTSGNRTVHATGNFSGLALGGFNLNFKNDGSGVSYVTIISFTIHTLNFNAFDIPAFLKATPGTQTNISAGGSGRVQSQPISGTTSNPYFTLQINPAYWHDVDFIDISFYVTALSLNSIACATVDDVFIPIEHSIVLSGDSSSDLQYNNFYVICRLDLSELDRSLDTKIQLIVDVTSPDSLSCSMDVVGIRGVIVSAPIDAELKWYQILWNTISDGFDSVVQTLEDLLGTDDSFDEGAKEELGNANQSMEDYASGIKDKTPAVDNADINGSVYEFAELWAGLQPGITSPLNIIFGIGDGIFGQLIFYLSVAALIGYIFFGRKS